MLSRRTLAKSAVAALASSLAMMGCTPPAQQSSSGTSGSQSPAPAADDLVIYSNSLSDGRDQWLTEQAKGAGFKLSLVSLGGGDVQNRLLAEKNNPLADVVFGLNNVYYEKLKTAEVLAPHTPNWAGDIDAGLGDQEIFWPIVREPIMLVYSKEAYPNGQGAPTDWPDLWTKPEFKNKYEVPTKLGGATIQMVISGILTRYTDPSGDLGVSEEGWQAIEAFFANGNPAVQGEDLYARMKAGTVTAGQMWLAGKNTREKQYDIETEAVRPTIGVPYAVQHTALVQGSKKVDEAKRFIDWFGGEEVQASWSNKFFTAPTNTRALANASQEAVKMTDSFTAQKIDWAFVAKNIDAWVEKIQLQYLG